MAHEEEIAIWGAAALMGFDDGDGTKEFLARTKYKSKIDQVIDFYGIPYCRKNDINKFLRYNVQERHQPIVHDHFYHVLKSTGYGVDDFDYKKLQDEFNARQEKPDVALDIQINMERFMEQQQAEQTVAQPADQKVIMDEMKGMLEEIKELKKQALSTKQLHDWEKTDTAWESEDGESHESERKEGWWTDGRIYWETGIIKDKWTEKENAD